MLYLYDIAHMKILCKIPFEITFQEESIDFIKEVKDINIDYDFVFEFKKCQCLPVIGKQYHQEIQLLFYRDNDQYVIYHCNKPNGDAYACVIYDKNDFHHIRCFYLEGMESYMNYSHNICDLMSLEYLLKINEGILLHASFIKYKQKAILFSAPSGTGKSTQAHLWNCYESAKIINGDRVAIKNLNAYGLPYAGSSHIYLNESAKIAMIVILRQAKENKIRRLTGNEALRYVISETSLHYWNNDFVNDVIMDIVNIVQNVPVFLLECLPDKGAVELVKNEFKEIYDD